ncbi:MAG TPA: EF-P lysine aminoacylase EpmA [Myxococcota bacterium]|nr:EF-P lysine aminoacylase EpmA [Myxococcota bacterium]
MSSSGRVAAVRDGGRSLAGSASPRCELVLFDAGRLATVVCERAPDGSTVRPGDLVTVEAGVVRVHSRGEGEWPPSMGERGADLARFTPERFERLRRRARLIGELRSWFERQGFLEVETPLVVPSPGTEVHLDPVPIMLSEGPGRAPLPRWLITSPEYAMKRLLAAGAPPIYQICKVFRDGERGGNHRPEFTMLEWYRPWVDGYECLMRDCEDLVTSLAGDSLTWGGRRFDLRPPWPRHTFHTLLRERADIADPYTLDPEAQLFAWVDRVEATLGQERPELVIEWPVALASLSRVKASDPRVAERFELYLGRLELANAFAELTDADEQRRRCEEDNAERLRTGRPALPLDEDFLGALAAGMPPSAGIALGLDRLMMVLTDAASIDEVLAF